MILPEEPWNVDDWNPEIYRYDQIAQWVEQRVKAGVWPARTTISEIQLQAYFGVGRGTIRQAMSLLRERGLIKTLPGKGSVVTSQGDVLD